MKKILIALLTIALCIGLVACGGNDAEVTTAEVTTTAPAENNTPVAGNVITPDVADGTVGAAHWEAFVAALAENADATAEELGNTLVTLPINQFMGGAMPLDGEFFPGFDNYVVTGYENGAMFMPMIGSIPYVGYVFDMAEGADIQAFIETLTSNCNPRWNICVTADQTVAGAVGDKVFFLMCPETYEMPTEEGGDMGGMALAE